MQQEVYPNQNILPIRRRYRICGCLDISYGGPIVCFFWMLVNMYGCVLSFRNKSPVYSYLNHACLVIQGVVCLLFALSAFLSMYSFSSNRIGPLTRSHRWTWTFVILFLIVYFINMIVFGVQRPQFLDWCIDKSRKMEVNSLVIKNDMEHTIGGLNVTEVSSFVFLPIREGSDLYNCTRLWEDEVKFSVVTFVILFALYVHFAFCFWYHTQERRIEEEIIYDMLNVYPNNFNNNMNSFGGMRNVNVSMMNAHPSTKNPADIPEVVVDDGQRSLAQITRAVFGRLRS
ncbi:hypothetical protein BD770DRAFT_166632 [Pilaira anomala]|nr:hypothetical protein BD770DRAFT_166632 [Pilaira anomala]